MKITSLHSTLEQIGYANATLELNKEKESLDVQYEKAQKDFAIALRKRLIDPDDFYFNPQDSYIRLSDHAERRLHKNTWICIDMDRSSDTAMAKSMLGIRFESTRYIQDVDPSEQNLTICAETLEYFAELMKAFEYQDLVEDYIRITNEYWGYLLSQGIRIKKAKETKDLGEQLINAAKYVTNVLVPAGIDTQESAEEYVDSMHGTEIFEVWEAMGSPGEYPKNSKEAKRVVKNHLLVDETKL